MGVILTIVALSVTFWMARRSLVDGICSALTFGYAFGILRANFPETSSYFIFDAAVLGLYAAQSKLITQPFTTQDGQLAAVGTLTGTVTNLAGNVVGTVSQQLTLPTVADGTCQVLNLVLGPLDLNLLGLTVHLDQVVLDITAQSGPGNLLGSPTIEFRAGLIDLVGRFPVGLSARACDGLSGLTLGFRRLEDARAVWGTCRRRGKDGVLRAGAAGAHKGPESPGCRPARPGGRR